MKYRAIILGFAMCLSIFVSMPNNLLAAFRINDGDINIEILPDNPEPYSDVTIKFRALPLISTEQIWSGK